MIIYDYTYERDAFWSARYPVSKTLYGIYKFIAWATLIGGGIWFLYMLFQGAILFAWVPLIYFAITALFMFFFAELTLMQVDKNYLLYHSSNLQDRAL